MKPLRWVCIAMLLGSVACGDDVGPTDRVDGSVIEDGGTGSDSGGDDAGVSMDGGMDGTVMDASSDAGTDAPPMDGGPCADGDSDGITDIYEGAETGVDTDMDGTPDAEDADSDGDGISDADEFGSTACMEPADSDGDGIYDFRDTDSDDNGVSDADEGTDDPDGDGIPNHADDDNDGDDVSDIDELAGMDPPPDFDGDGTPDYLDEDSDNDTISDRDEGTADSNMDGTPDRNSLDSDGDGLSDADEAGDADLSTRPRDTDFDLIPDFQDLDSDGDGLSDEEESMGPTDPYDSDSDGDGASDLVETAAGTDPTDGADNPRANGDFVFVMNYLQEASPSRDILDFATDIQVGDVYFLMDTTGSMSGSITALQSAIRSSLIPGIRAAIPDTWFGVGEFRDYPITPYGGATDQPFTNFQDITNDVAAAQAATSSYRAAGGYDGPEAHGQAMYALATGDGLPSSSVGARTDCPAGTFGWACFRDTAVPIVVMITDIYWHNGPGDAYAYTSIPGAPSYSDVVTATRDARIKFIGVGQGTLGVAHMQQFGRDVGSVDTAGEPFVSTYSGGDAALTATIVDQIRSVIEVPIDVSTVFMDDPSDAVDTEMAFLERIEANEAGDAARGCAPRMGEDTDGDGFPDVFRAVPPGERVCFDVVVKINETVEPTTEPQLFRATVQVLGDGFTPLDSRDVFFLVPPTIGI